MRCLFLNNGYCRQLMALVDRRTWRITPFHAVFLAVEHPRLGWVLIDTGYGERFHAATTRWPYRLYRLATPVYATEPAAAVLRRRGIDPEEIRHIIVTHFHADHVGGLAEFPRARIYHTTEALAPLRELTPFQQTRHAFLPGLVPGDLAQRSTAIPLAAFVPDPGLGFARHDVFGDGSIHLVDLPGHAPGHVGVQLETATAPLFYAVDAFWNVRQIREDIAPLPPARLAIHDFAAYNRTIARLRELSRAGSNIVACHCPTTQALISP